tara:strand:+ start:2458 stop:2685 length:228 start_codon:yes stop_codon:yes gene_type:complete
MNNSIHVVTEKYKFYEAKSIIRNSSEYAEKTIKKAEILVSAYYVKNPHLLEPIPKVDKSYLDSEEFKRMKQKYKI